MKGVTVGFALTGSFCTFRKALEQMQRLVDNGFNVLPIMSYNASSTDTRFGKAEDFLCEIKAITGHPVIKTIVEAEPIGPKKMLDLLLIEPCTGNTLAKLANAVTDTPVTMAAKSHLRIGRPVLLSIASNDALGASAQNIGRLMNTKHIFFVPFAQDDPENKPNSLVSRFDLTLSAVEQALQYRQLQPVLR